MLLLLFYLFLALVVSFLCSVMESVLLSTPISFLNVKKKKGDGRAITFIQLKKNIDRPLSAILSLNTIAHTIGAAGVGAQATHLFGEVYFGLVSAVLTLLILFFSEIIPKTIGARYWRELAMNSGMIINAMVYVSYPLVILTGYITKLFSSKNTSMQVSREELSAMAHIGTKEGSLEENENRIIQNLIRLKTISVSAIMTPRVVVSMADEQMSIHDFLTQKEYLYYSRIPVYAEQTDNITGYVFRQSVFDELTEDQKKLKLKDIKRDIIVVPKFQTLLITWETLLERKEQIALVVDEYGGMDGIVSMEDILETLLGLEIVDEVDRVVDMQQYARERWERRKAKYNIFLDQRK
ncbi:CNNM domain-containing protein [Labilibaculum sp.]|uniref:CNNM domain-containing protein n=1 Tax=Labilibaculum sp. TaxID=2060723 RepID=UPI003565A02D